MANQYDVLGKAPVLEDLNKLSPKEIKNDKRVIDAYLGAQ
mgnify:CR=1 FL=1